MFGHCSYCFDNIIFVIKFITIKRKQGQIEFMCLYELFFFIVLLFVCKFIHKSNCSMLHIIVMRFVFFLIIFNRIIFLCYFKKK